MKGHDDIYINEVGMLFEQLGFHTLYLLAICMMTWFLMGKWYAFVVTFIGMGILAFFKLKDLTPFISVDKIYYYSILLLITLGIKNYAKVQESIRMFFKNDMNYQGWNFYLTLVSIVFLLGLIFVMLAKLIPGCLLWTIALMLFLFRGDTEISAELMKYIVISFVIYFLFLIVNMPIDMDKINGESISQKTKWKRRIWGWMFLVVEGSIGFVIREFPETISWVWIQNILKTVYSKPIMVIAAVIWILSMIQYLVYVKGLEGTMLEPGMFDMAMSEIRNDEKLKSYMMIKYRNQRKFAVSLYTVQGMVLLYFLSFFLGKWYHPLNGIILLYFIFYYLTVSKKKVAGYNMRSWLYRMIMVFGNIMVIYFCLSHGLILNMILTLVIQVILERSIKKQMRQHGNSIELVLVHKKIWIQICVFMALEILVWLTNCRWCYDLPHIDIFNISIGIPLLSTIMLLVIGLIVVIVAINILDHFNTVGWAAPNWCKWAVVLAFLTLCLGIGTKDGFSSRLEYNTKDNGQRLMIQAEDDTVELCRLDYKTQQMFGIKEYVAGDVLKVCKIQEKATNNGSGKFSIYTYAIGNASRKIYKANEENIWVAYGDNSIATNIVNWTPLMIKELFNRQ